MASSRVRRGTMGVVATVVALIASMLIMENAGAAAATAVDYSQCMNGSLGADDATDSGCVSWGNGILQASNSHYREDEVTPQRLTVRFNTTGEHTLTLRYQTRKGAIHAYDSLASVDYTQEDAVNLRCMGLSACASAATTDEAIIPVDTGTPGSFTDSTGHVLPDASRKFKVFGGTIVSGAGDVAVATYGHDMSGSDEYASITIKVNATRNEPLQLLFGGHIAAPEGPRGWGLGLGAASISGGPYHIKWAAADGASVGNRDNQLQGGSILQYFSPSLTSVASPSSVYVGVAATLSDTAYYVPATGASTSGAVTFSLWGPFSTAPSAGACTTATFSGGPIATATSTTWALDTSDPNVTNRYVASGSVNVSSSALSIGDYYWVVSYAGDGGQTLSASHGCGDPSEKVSVTKASPTGATVISLKDTLNVTAVTGGATPSGPVNFKLYRSGATCTETLVYDSGDSNLGGTGNPNLSSGSASSDLVSVSTAGTYNWVVTYNGDANNNGVTKACGTETAVVSYN